MLHEVLIQARCAPSGANLQPGCFVQVRGSARDALSADLVQAWQQDGEEAEDYSYFPQPMTHTLRRRQVAAAQALYGALGVARDDRAGRDAQFERNFRFFDNRQKYLLFVNTCSEKWVVASRVALELANVHPRPPALRLFDAGVGDGTVLLRVMRAMHDRFPHTPFYVVGKEISLEDVRLSLDKMPDRFYEHPATVMVVTNMYYSEAPWLAPKAGAAGAIFCHNHPSGDPTPSTEDAIITRRLKEAGDLIGIAVLDHIIIGDGQYVSFVERGLL